MGQSASSPSRADHTSRTTPSALEASDRAARRRGAVWRQEDAIEDIVGPLSTDAQPSTARSRRVSQLIDGAFSRRASPNGRTSRLTTRLRRSSRSFLFGSDSSGGIFTRGDRNTSSPEVPQAESRRQQRSRDVSPSTRPSTAPPNHIRLPDVNVSDFDLDFSSNTASSSSNRLSPQHRSSVRLASTLSDRLATLRSSHRQTAATANAVLRRRRPAVGQPEDNTALLSRLLSVAAAATAATLLEGSEHTIADARGMAGDGDDGTFDSFLQSLENGRLAAALRQGGQQSQEPGSSPTQPLNLFRMFRFGSTSLRSPTRQQSTNNRMVPIIIVGIRAVTPGSSANAGEDTGVPPFLDALSTLPTTPFNANSLGQDIADGLRGSPHGVRLSRRRRTSLSGYDNQRHPGSTARPRPQSMSSEPASWPRPPPATPASPTLSRANTPAPTVPTSRRSSYSGASRGESIIRTTTTTTLETTTEDTPAQARPVRARTANDPEHRNSIYAARRNGVVEPDAGVTENTRSWIIYVLGGSYPENHPILTTPSLFTDAPTYEDMMLLSTLLGPAKPPVASETDIASAGGVYRIKVEVNDANDKVLVAAAEIGEDKMQLTADQRCLVCLCDFEEHEEARKLKDCGHLYHRECIDEWLTKGRNSCPLCRAQGVQEQHKPTEAPPVDSTAPSPVIPSEPEAVAVA